MGEDIESLSVSISLVADTSGAEQIVTALDEIESAAERANQALSGTGGGINTSMNELTPAVTGLGEGMTTAGNNARTAGQQFDGLERSISSITPVASAVTQSLVQNSAEITGMGNTLAESVTIPPASTVTIKETTTAIQQLSEAQQEVYDAWGDMGGVGAGNMASIPLNIISASDQATTAATKAKQANTQLAQSANQTTVATQQTAAAVDNLAETTGWDALKNNSKDITNLGKLMTVGLTVPLVTVGKASMTAANEFETAFVGVTKTVDGTTEQYATLRDEIMKMSKETMFSQVQIANVAQAAGQLGVGIDDVAEFSKVMLMMGSATELSATQAATQLARFAAITGMDLKNIKNLGSSIVDLGNHFSATEPEIVSMGLRLAGAGTQVGMTEADIMGLATGLTHLGLNLKDLPPESASAIDAQISDMIGSVFAEIQRVMDGDPNETSTSALKLTIKNLEANIEGAEVTVVGEPGTLDEETGSLYPATFDKLPMKINTIEADVGDADIVIAKMWTTAGAPTMAGDEGKIDVALPLAFKSVEADISDAEVTVIGTPTASTDEAGNATGGVAPIPSLKTTVATVEADISAAEVSVVGALNTGGEGAEGESGVSIDVPVTVTATVDSSAAQAAVDEAVAALASAVEGIEIDGSSAIASAQAMAEGIASAMASGAEAVASAATAMSDAANSITIDPGPAIAGAQAMAEGIAGAMASGVAAVQAAAAAMQEAAEIHLDASGAYASGAAVGEGLASGLSSQIGAVQAAAAKLAAAAAEAAAEVRSKLKVASPSKVMMELGEYIGEGLQIGLERSTLGVLDTARGLGDRVFGALTATDWLGGAKAAWSSSDITALVAATNGMNSRLGEILLGGYWAPDVSGIVGAITNLTSLGSATGGGLGDVQALGGMVQNITFNSLRPLTPKEVAKAAKTGASGGAFDATKTNAGHRGYRSDGSFYDW